MKYNETTGFFTKTIVSKKKGVKDREELIAEFTFQYADRNGHPVPHTTFAVVPFKGDVDGALELGIGWTWCSDKDNPNKKKGRSTAQARAVGAIKNHKRPNITLRTGTIVGQNISAHRLTAKDLMHWCYMTEDTANRILKAAAHLIAQSAK